MPLRSVISSQLERQRAAALIWGAVALAAGIGWYFSRLSEPSALAIIAMLSMAVLAVMLIPKSSMTIASALLFTALFLLGFTLAFMRANLIAAPVLGFRYYGPVEGRIIMIDKSARNRPRITLDQVVLRDVPPSKTPEKLRVSLYYKTPYLTPQPGQRVMITASLSPPASPVEPGGFDFQRFAWFRGLGAVGYARTPLLQFAPPDTHGFNMWLIGVRLGLSEAIKTRIEGKAGAFAAAIVTGDRSAIEPAQLEDLRASNLAHLLAISGLHMGLLTGFIFGALRYGMALVPPLALRLPVKKIAAVGALVAAAAYLALSGANVATQRAFVMVAVMLLAILLNRRALTLRAVAIAAIIVLVLRPESLISVGFQMSFAATTALVSVFALLRIYPLFRPSGGLFRKISQGILALAISSAVAGAATAPFSAYHFNQFSQYGLIANLASVPVMGLAVMPAAVLAGLLAPFGLDGPAFWLMGAGINWILTVAHWVAGLEGSVLHIAKPDVPVLPMIALGCLFLILWRGPLRVAGVLPVLVALVLWSQSQRPDILLSANGRLLGVMNEQGRALNRAKGNGFAAESWLENDGDAAGQLIAAGRMDAKMPKNGNWVALPRAAALYIWSKKDEDIDMSKICDQYQIVILPNITARTGDCLVISKPDFRRHGAFAFRISGNNVKITNARQVTGTRLWSR